MIGSVSRPREKGPEPAPARRDEGTPSGETRRTLRPRWAFRLIAAGVLPLLGLLVIECLLRLAGFGYPTGFFVHHPATGPDRWVENQRFPWRFFPVPLTRHPNPVVVAARKPPETCRIFVFGESAAEGDPAPAFGFSRILEVLLRARYPQTRFEVVNVAFTAINSHVILPIAHDCARLEGDFWLLYMGNNEVIGPFGTGTVLGRQAPPLPLVRLTLALKATRVGQLLDAAGQWLRPGAVAEQGWRGMSMFLDHRVRRDDPGLARVYRHFKHNLGQILDQARAAGARVIVSTMVSRVRDWPPFASLHRPDLTATQRQTWEQHYEAATTADAAGDLAEAIRHYEQAAQLDDSYAELLYRWGRACLAMGRTNEARRHLTSARDLDTLRFRTDSPLNGIIRETVGTSPDGVHLVDAERAFAELSPEGLPGEEWLYEHVHFNFAGNYRLARLFADEIARHLASVPPGSPAEAPPPPWLSEEVCATRLAYSDSQRHDVARILERRFAEAIYQGQLGHTGRLARLEAEIMSLRASAKPTGRRRALELCRQALATAPDDWVLHDLAARLLGVLGDANGAQAAWREVARLIPHHARPYTELAKLDQARGDLEAAAAGFRQALAVNPDAAEALEGLGLICASQGRSREATGYLRRALHLDPTRQAARDALAQGSKGPTPTRPRRQRCRGTIRSTAHPVAAPGCSRVRRHA